MKYFGLSETKLFHFHGKFWKNEIISTKRTPHFYKYEPPFQKSWIRPCLFTQLLWERSGSVVECLSAWLMTEGPRVRASPASLLYGPWARHIYPSLVLVQPRKTRPFLTERLLKGRKKSNQSSYCYWKGNNYDDDFEKLYYLVVALKFLKDLRPHKSGSITWGIFKTDQKVIMTSLQGAMKLSHEGFRFFLMKYWYLSWWKKL